MNHAPTDRGGKGGGHSQHLLLPAASCAATFSCSCHLTAHHLLAHALLVVSTRFGRVLSRFTSPIKIHLTAETAHSKSGIIIIIIMHHHASCIMHHH
eukprot:COSAG01_NODE_7112_length_3346_cov_3.335694_1_plen_96_part_10